MPIYGKNLKKSSLLQNQLTDDLEIQYVSIMYMSTTKIVQIITLGWPWPI